MATLSDKKQEGRAIMRRRGKDWVTGGGGWATGRDMGYIRDMATVGVLQPDQRGRLRPECVVIFFGMVFVGLLVLTGGKL